MGWGQSSERRLFRSTNRSCPTFSVRSQARSLRASSGGVGGLRAGYRRGRRGRLGSRRFARDGVGVLQLADVEINWRSGFFLAEGTAFAAFNAAAAEGALAGIVAPHEVAFSGAKLDGACGAAESADGATGAKLGVELDRKSTRLNSSHLGIS